MNEIITVRDSEIIAAEINTIKEDTRRIMIANAIRIGGKLMEAKSMVDHGSWGKWLQEKVDYSQSTANNLMQLYREYGENQESFFDTWTKSETFANLTYTQHMALLALPFSDRQEFAESHDVENMSTRELEKAIREELEQTKAQLAAAEQRADEAEQKAIDAEQLAEKRTAEIESESKDAKRMVDAFKASTEAAEKAKARAEKSELNALNLVKKLEKQLSDAQAAEKAAAEELKKSSENPTVPESVMEQMRAEVAADAAKEATEKIQKQLDAAVSAQKAAEQAARDAEEKLADAQKAAKVSNPIVTEAIVRAQKLQNDFNELNGFRLKQEATDHAVAESIKKMMVAMVGQWCDALGI